MTKIYLYLLSFISLYSTTKSVQPYFPPQIVFSLGDSERVYAIDETNQQAYTTIHYGTTGQETSYVMKHFPYAIRDSPQSKSYVQLLTDSAPLGCMYGTYWEYGGNTFNSFPSHWWTNTRSFEIKNYIQFSYEMIHSTDSSVDEDHWYSNVTCQPDGVEPVPCEEIYFKKNTDIPLRLVQVLRRGWAVIQVTTNYKVISVGKPDDKYFDSIPKNWSVACRDVMLGLLYYPQISVVPLNRNAKVQVWLITPPHQINGNDTVTIQWKPANCTECFTWTPKELSFNSENFQERQTLTITRLKNHPEISFIPIFNGGGFDQVISEIYPFYIE